MSIGIRPYFRVPAILISLFLVSFSQVMAQGPFGGNPPPPGMVSAMGRKLIGSTADGTTTTLMYFAAMDNAEIRKDFGFTDEQNRQFREVRTRIQQEMTKNMPKTLQRMQNYTPEAEKEILAEIQDGIQKVRTRFDEIITPEQKQKAVSLSFQAFGGLDSPFVNMEMVSTLELSEEQKEKARELFKETEKERVEIMEAGLAIAERAVAKGRNMTEEDRRAVEAEFKALEGRVYASGKKLGNRIREFLTDAQKKKADELMASRPSYFPKLPRQLRAEEDDGEWKPSDSSWRPGQGVDNPTQRREGGRFPGSRRTPSAEEPVKPEE